MEVIFKDAIRQEIHPALALSPLTITEPEL
jgi:hypothetical protein